MKTMMRLGLVFTDYLAKKSGYLDQEEKQEFVDNMRGSDVYYLYNKHIEKLTANEFFQMYFNNTISHISRKNIKQLTLAKRISPTESREYLAETHSLITRLISESKIIESAGSSKCFEHPRPDQFRFIIEDTDDNVSLYIQTQDLQLYLEGQESQGMVSNKLAPRMTRRFSTTSTKLEDIDDVLVRLQTTLGPTADYDAYVRFHSCDESDDKVTYTFDVEGPEADMLVSDLSEYPSYKLHSVQSVAGDIARGVRDTAATAGKAAFKEAIEPVQAITSRFKITKDDHGNHRAHLPGAEYMYRDMLDEGTITLEDGDIFSKKGGSKDYTIEEIGKTLEMQPEKKELEEVLEDKGFKKTGKKQPAKSKEGNKSKESEPETKSQSDTDVPTARVFSGYTRDRNPFPNTGGGSKRGKLGANETRRDLWDNIISVLWDMSDKELDSAYKTITGTKKETKKQSKIPLFNNN